MRDTSPVMDAGAHLDVGAPDKPTRGTDGPAKNGLDAAAATECSYGGRTYAVGDSFPNDCVCFGSFVPLRPEVLTRYAAVLVRKVRSHPQEMGCISEDDLLAGNLEYQGVCTRTANLCHPFGHQYWYGNA